MDSRRRLRAAHVLRVAASAGRRQRDARPPPAGLACISGPAASGGTASTSRTRTHAGPPPAAPAATGPTHGPALPSVTCQRPPSASTTTRSPTRRSNVVEPGVVDAVGPLAAGHDEQAPPGVLLQVQAAVLEELGRNGQRTALRRGRPSTSMTSTSSLVVESVVARRHVEHQVVRREVGAVGDPFTVVPLVSGIQREDGGVGVHAPPLAPGGGDDRPVRQSAARRDEIADHGNALEGIPEAPGPVVEHQLVRAVQQAARPEPDVLAVDHALVGNDGAAQRAVDEWSARRRPAGRAPSRATPGSAWDRHGSHRPPRSRTRRGRRRGSPPRPPPDARDTPAVECR